MTRRLTTPEFIERAKAAHGNKYDYEKAVYVNSDHKVLIVCKEHGDFLQRAIAHVKGTGCPACAGVAKKTTEQFIAEAQQVHGNKYTYENTRYTGAKGKVSITCRTHGEFLQNAADHTNGRGCILCSGKNLKTAEQFVADAVSVHGDRYSYEKVNYVNSGSKVLITCKKHGVFSQTPNNHLLGQGCRVCSGTAVGTTEQFVTSARAIHGNKYNYDNARYKSTKTKLTIICSTHGEFLQTPGDHLNGVGCPVCGGTARKSTEQFVSEAQKVHGDRYGYEKVQYLNSKVKVSIFCSEHGAFMQRPAEHLNGGGCPACSEKGFDRTSPAWLYVLRMSFSWTDAVGYGITGDIRKRLSVHKRNLSSVGGKFEVVTTRFFESGVDALNTETQIANRFESIDLGVDGFHREAAPIRFLPEILELVSA